jgi:mannuronan synthase
MNSVIAHLIFLLVMGTLALLPPREIFSAASGTVLAIGAIGIWRYSWALTNLVRAALYQLWFYPRLRSQRAARYQRINRKDHAFFLVTSFKIAPEISTRVYRSIFEAAFYSNGGATIVASIVDEADGRLIRQVFAAVKAVSLKPDGHVQLQIDKIEGTGKRDALATSLQSIARLGPTNNDIVLFVDGDSCVPLNVIEKTLPFFLDPMLGAVTSDELGDTEGGKLFKDWFDLRFAQRHVMMSSVSLGSRVLTLTGRMSIFRASFATDPGFIRQVRSDYIDHWRLGRVGFLTGDDKSTWYWLLSHGYKMLYMPDIQLVSIETQPKPGFIDSSVTLMTRWFGNMLRTNGRALKLPARKIGFFTWASLLDQQISIWTTLLGPTSVILGAIFVSPWILVIYAAWVMFTRYMLCTLIMAFRRASFPVTYPFILYYSQVVGAFAKSFIMFRMDRQKWTRQSAVGGKLAAVDLTKRLRTMSSTYMHALVLGWLVVAAAYFSHLL